MIAKSNTTASNTYTVSSDTISNTSSNVTLNYSNNCTTSTGFDYY